MTDLETARTHWREYAEHFTGLNLTATLEAAADYIAALEAENNNLLNDKAASDESIAALEAECEGLKCCGSCRWCGSVEYLNCTHDDVPERERGEFYVSLDDRCHFTPSRWERRTP